MKAIIYNWKQGDTFNIPLVPVKIIYDPAWSKSMSFMIYINGEKYMGFRSIGSAMNYLGIWPKGMISNYITTST